MLAEAYAGAGRSRDAIAWLEERAAGRSAAAAGAGRFLRARAPLVGCRGRVRPRAAAGAAQRRSEDALRVGAAERRRPRQSRQGSRCAHRRSVDADAGDRHARAVSAVAGAAPPRRFPGGRSDGAPRHHAEWQESWGTTRWPKRRRTGPPLSGRRRRVVARGGPAPGHVGRPSFDVGLLLPHLGFAYQEIGQHDKAIASFEDARRLSRGIRGSSTACISSRRTSPRRSTARPSTRRARRRRTTRTTCG